MSIVVKRIRRPDKRQVLGLKGASVASVHECLGIQTSSLMDSSIKPVLVGTKVTGPAVTVDCYPGDNLTLHIAISLCEPGDVLVVNGRGAKVALWGALMSAQAAHRKIGGVVIDGAVRDSEEIRRTRFACFASAITAQGAVKRTLGSINTTISVGGVVVTPGDLVIGDDDGVVVVPINRVRTMRRLVIERERKEAATRRLYSGGKTSVELYHFDEYLKSKNVRVVESADGV